MFRFNLLAAAVLAAWSSTASAQVYVRAPFVRVSVDGPGVQVRAPFVNLFIPTGPPVVYYSSPPNGPPFVIPGRPSSAPTFTPPPPTVVPPPMPPAEVGPAPKVDPKVKEEPPVEIPAGKAPTLEEFSRSFKPKAGNYEVTLFSPVTRMPTTVRFTLPEGTPRRVQVNRNSIEFDYGRLSFVRIEFDPDGAVVISR